MNTQQVQPQTVQPMTVQALWVAQAITVLGGIAMFCYFAAEVLKVGSGVFKEAFKK